MLPINTDTNYYVVMEQTTPEGSKAEIVYEGKSSSGDLNFLRFRQCLQSFGHYNRNRRLWKREHIELSLQNPWIQQQLREKGGLPGENGHPISQIEGKPVSKERIVTIDPNNICLLLKDYEFKGDNMLFGTIETIDDGNGPGNRFMRNILQGIDPAVSCRSMVPQRKNPDGTTDVTGPGRLICYDRVFIPSHEEAFRDHTKPITNVIKGNKISPAYESMITDADFTSWAANKCDNVKFILEDLQPVMESYSIDKEGFLGVKTDIGHVYIPLRQNKKIMREIKDFMK